MLRLTLKNADSRRPLMTAEGRLIGEWSVLLDAECARVLQGASRLDLDIAGVTDVDAQGLSVVRRLARGAVTLTGATPIMAALLEEGDHQ